MRQITEGFTGALSLMSNAANTFLMMLTTNWNASWQQIYNIFLSTITAISENLTTTTAAMTALLTQWFTQLQTLVTTNLTILQTSWLTAWNQIRTDTLNVTGQILANLSAWGDAIVGVIASTGGRVVANWSYTLGVLYSQTMSTFGSMLSYAQSALAGIAAAAQAAIAQVLAAAQQMRQQLVRGSIWPDMLNEMQSQTETALGNIVSDFQGAFGGIALSVPVIPSQGRSMAGAEGSAPVLPQVPQTITIPITTTVTLDGQIIARLVEQRIVDHIKYRSRRVA